MSKEEQIGYHKGALSVLAKEKEEFMKILSVVSQIIEAHLKALKDLGVDLEAESKKFMEENKKQESNNNNYDDLANRLG